MGGRFDDPLDVGIPQVGCRHKYRRSSFLATGIDPIQHQHVEMRIEIQRTAEALDKGHRAALDSLRSPCRRIPEADPCRSVEDQLHVLFGDHPIHFIIRRPQEALRCCCEYLW
jgi:hypothetical protein